MPGIVLFSETLIGAFDVSGRVLDHRAVQQDAGLLVAAFDLYAITRPVVEYPRAISREQRAVVRTSMRTALLHHGAGRLSLDGRLSVDRWLSLDGFDQGHGRNQRLGTAGIIEFSTSGTEGALSPLNQNPGAGSSRDDFNNASRTDRPSARTYTGLTP